MDVMFWYINHPYCDSSDVQNQKMADMKYLWIYTITDNSFLKALYKSFKCLINIDIIIIIIMIIDWVLPIYVPLLLIEEIRWKIWITWHS